MSRLGISVEPVSSDVAQQLQIPVDARGLIVTDVTPGGPAWEVLFDDPQRGGPDIILSIEGKPVRSEGDLRKALQAEKPGSIVSLRIFNPRAQARRVERIRLGGREVGRAPAAACRSGDIEGGMPDGMPLPRAVRGRHPA